VYEQWDGEKPFEFSELKGRSDLFCDMTLQVS